MKIVIPAPILTSQEAKDKLVAMGSKIYEDRPTSQQELAERIKDAEIVTINNTIGITAETIDVCPNLKYIIVPAVGYECVDLERASARGITVINCPTHNSQAVAEFAIGLLLAANRQIPQANSNLRNGKWDDESFIGNEISGKKLGLMGNGNIGKRITEIAKAFGASVSYVNSKSSTEELERLLSESDFICVCAPHNDKTHHILNEARLDLLKQDAILINVARGALIDQKALIEVLKNGKIRAAGLDVFEGESKHLIDNPEISELANLPNVVATPHIAYNTNEARLKLDQEIITAIESCLNGHPINMVNN